jgi:hypothetical protein
MNQKNDAVLLQCGHTAMVFVDMMRITYQRQMAYCCSHHFDYWHMYWSVCPDKDAVSGAWDKIELLQLASKYDYYKYLVWMDTDAAIVKDVDLREALPEGKSIGACLHDWEKKDPEGCKKTGLFTHHNVGVLFFRNNEITREFLQDWIDTYPGHPRWHEQWYFNELIKSDKYKQHFATRDDKWNSTPPINEVADPVIRGFHGIAPWAERLNTMARAFQDDVFNFRVR